MSIEIVGAANTQPAPSCHHPGMAQTTLAQRVKGLRIERGLSVDEAADAIGPSRSYLSGIENGHDNPGREILIAIANFYEVSLDWLTTGEGEKRPEPILSPEEDTLLRAYRKLPPEEAAALLSMLLARTQTVPSVPALRYTAPKRGRR